MLANSPYAAPVLFIKKKGGGLRLCMDYQGINAVSMSNAYPLPLIRVLLRVVAGGEVIFTKLDLRDACFQVCIREGDERKTSGQFEYFVMPFGLPGPPGVFMNLINEALHEYLYKGMVVYLDDVLIYSKDYPSHIELVRKVLGTLYKNKLYAELSKCKFRKEELDFLECCMRG